MIPPKYDVNIPKYTLFTRGACNKCVKAKEYLTEKNVPFNEVYLLTEHDIKNLKDRLPESLAGASISLPVVFDHSGKYIGDLTDMIRDVENRVDYGLNKQVMFEALKNNICVVVFTKVNGDQRRMMCTLAESKLPEDFRLSNKSQNNNFLAVYDIEEGGWRGFRVDSVQSFTVVEAV